MGELKCYSLLRSTGLGTTESRHGTQSVIVRTVLFASPYRVATPSVIKRHPISQSQGSFVLDRLLVRGQAFAPPYRVATPSVLQFHPIFQGSFVLYRILCRRGSFRSPIPGCYSFCSPTSSHLSGVCRLGQITCSGGSFPSPRPGCYSVCSPASSHLSGVCRLGQITFLLRASSPHPYLIASLPILKLPLQSGKNHLAANGFLKLPNFPYS
jgi:hypothetical protein